MTPIDIVHQLILLSIDSQSVFIMLPQYNFIVVVILHAEVGRIEEILRVK